jgi:hypothetical protein
MEAKTRQSTSLDAGLMAIVSVGYAVCMYTWNCMDRPRRLWRICQRKSRKWWKRCLQLYRSGSLFWMVSSGLIAISRGQTKGQQDMQSHNHFQIPLTEYMSIHAELTSWVTMHFLPIYRPVPSHPPTAVTTLQIVLIISTQFIVELKSTSEVSIMFQLITCQFPGPRFPTLWEC